MNFEEMQEKMKKQSKGKLEFFKAEEEKTTVFNTNTYDLNRIISGSLFNSVKSRTHTLIVGPEASGKSSFMALNLAAAQKQGFIPLIIDCEGAFDQEFMERWGIDTTRVLIIRSMFVDEITQELTNLIEDKFQNLAIAFDSIGALEQLKLLADGKKNDIKADQGGLQKKIKRMLKLLVHICKRQNSMAISAGHYHGNPNSYGNADEIGGGKYLKLSADVTILLKKSPLYENPAGVTLKEKGAIIGNQITAGTIKNRFYPAFLEGVLEINFKDGVNEMAGLVKVAIELGLIEKGGAWFTCEILGIKSQGIKKLYIDIEDVGNKRLLDAIEERLKTTGYSSVSDELEEINKEVKE